MVTYNSTISAVGEVDNYYVYLTSGRTYYFELEGSATGQGTLADPVMSLRPYPYTTVVATDDDGGVGLNSRIAYTATSTGWFGLDMRGFGSNTGSYRLNFSEDDYRNTPEGVGAAGNLGSGGAGTGTINYAGDRDVFAVNLTAGQTYHFEIQGSPTGNGTVADTYARLMTSSPGVGTIVAQDDDGGVGLNSRIVYTPTASGTYYLQAGEFGDNGTGTYRVFAHADEYRDTVEGTGAAGLIDTGATRAASLQVAGDHDIWSTTLISGLTYTIGERGSPSGGGTLPDAYLRVLSAANTQLAADDDSGVGLDSQVTYTATSTGTHYLEAGSFGDAYAGSYTLNISAGVATAANNVITGTAAVDAVNGAGGNDQIRGLGGNDWLLGGAGNDTLRGGAQNDLLTGNSGADILIGGANADRFNFDTVGDSTPGARDILRAGDGGAAFDAPGAGAGDRIDVLDIDANVLAGGNQSFTFGGTTAGHLWLTESGTNTIVNANIDGDAAIEFQLVIEDGGVRASAYSAADFIL
ncbi:MAG: hypothetical protein DI556_16285 [Rhodovulum sulfidophilum]|uniref:Peptidase C-terminal archaeal/bacterial domain-containing protein n=1 Tax=Rhodovulum sulfidophilum TaxID=35806 RepID=A0A2W5N2U0_RHOSU|nr:MAG: hypothetical protein DI556_16285 [Rhodovulum sulfidophilum]